VAKTAVKAGAKTVAKTVSTKVAKTTKAATKPASKAGSKTSVKAGSKTSVKVGAKGGTGDKTAAAAGNPGMSDEAIRRGTGKGWEEWFALLDKWGASDRTHTEIATWLNEVQGVGGWWSQGVTVGYERARGRRALGQLVDGFAASASKTVAVPLERLSEAFTDAKVRARWLPRAPFTVTTATPGKAVRGRWEDAAVAVAGARGAAGHSRVEIGLYGKGDAKSQAAIQHSKLRDAESAARMKAFWRERLEALQKLLEGAG
jgi:hypothetical protein